MSVTPERVPVDVFKLSLAAGFLQLRTEVPEPVSTLVVIEYVAALLHAVPRVHDALSDIVQGDFELLAVSSHVRFKMSPPRSPVLIANTIRSCKYGE